MNIESLSFQDMSFQYEGAQTVFESVKFEFPMNSNVLISAPSGAGRSTVLKLMAGLLMPNSGSYLINGDNVTEMSFEEFLPYRKTIGYACDFGGLLANRTLWDNLMLPLLYHNEISLQEAEDRIHDLMKRFNLLPYKDKRPASVPGGTRKTCIVVRAFVMKPQMLLLDDPTVAFDKTGFEALVQLINDFRKEGVLKHLFFTSRDDALKARLDCQVVHVEGSQFQADTEGFERKVA